MDGGDCLDVERVCRQQKKSHLGLCALTKMKTGFLLCFFFLLFLFLFSKMGLGYRTGETIGKQQVRRRRSFRS